MRRHGPEPQVVYALDGGLVPRAEFRDVPGWRGADPVVSGNNAAEQLQLGVFGDLFAIVALYVDNGNVLDAGHRPAARRDRRPHLRPLAEPGLGHVGAAGGPALHDVQARAPGWR